MAVPFELRIRNLLTKLLTNALILLCPLQTTGAIATGTLQTILHHLDDFLVFVESNCHSYTSFRVHYITVVNPIFYYLPLDKVYCLC